MVTGSATNKGFINTRVLKLNLGYVVAEGPGFSRAMSLEVPERLKVAEDLVVERLGGDLRVTRTSEGILLQAQFSCALLDECDRCLSQLEREFPFEVEELYVIGAASESSFSVGDDGILDLAPLVREEIFLSTASPVRCKPDCKGLCISCGHNLNSGPCKCDFQETDPRWAALSELQQKLADRDAN